MAQKGLIARAGKSLLGFLALLLRGVGALCAAFGSVLLFAFSLDSDHKEEGNGDALDDGMSMIEREDEATVSGWKSW